METTVNAPWTNGEEKFEGLLGFLQQCKSQLLYYKSKGNVTQHLLDDIAGYDEILNSGSETNARTFIEIKRTIRLGKSDLNFSTNLELVAHMKKENRWKSTTKGNTNGRN